MTPINIDFLADLLSGFEGMQDSCGLTKDGIIFRCRGTKCDICTFETDEHCGTKEQWLDWLNAQIPKGPWPCDPEKNKACTKESCYINGGECRETYHREYALK